MRACCQFHIPRVHEQSLQQHRSHVLSSRMAFNAVSCSNSLQPLPARACCTQAVCGRAAGDGGGCPAALPLRQGSRHDTQGEPLAAMSTPAWTVTDSCERRCLPCTIFCTTLTTATRSEIYAERRRGSCCCPAADYIWQRRTCSLWVKPQDLQQLARTQSAEDFACGVPALRKAWPGGYEISFSQHVYLSERQHAVNISAVLDAA